MASWQREGGRQADYARSQGLAPGLFSVWKCRLANSEASSASAAPPLIPVTVMRESREPPPRASASTSTTLH
ncbi:MAG: IS66 family insertion sequence element accessory protein TnpA [Pseudomonadota bacterium]